MLAGSHSVSQWVDLFSLKAGFALRTHLMPMALSYNKVIQTTPKVTGTSDQCTGDEAGTIMTVGGFNGNIPAGKIFIYSFQNGWLEHPTTLPDGLRSEVEAIVIP